MNYQRIYNEIITRAKASVYFEKTERHHIIPIFMGGTNTDDNLVNLTPRQHYLCHILLTKIVPKEKQYAAVKACYMMLAWSYSNQYRIKIRAGFSKKILRSRVAMPEETKQKLSFATKQQFLNPEMRKTHLEAVKNRFSKQSEHEKLSKAQRNRFKNQSEKDKISDSLKKHFEKNGSHNKGRSFDHLTIEQRKIIFGRKQTKGAKRSAETIAKMKQVWVDRKSKCS